MSFTNHKYNLRSGPFGLCSGYWDEKNRVFHRANKTEERKCCLNSCKPLTNECRDMCNLATNNKTCHETCDDIEEICEDNCDLLGDKNPIYNHGITNQINVDSVLKNKDEIIRFCRKNCVTTSEIDCQKHCEYIIKQNTPKYIHTNQNKNNIMLYALMFTVIIFVLYILIKNTHL